jgi:hypothetical protein
VKFEKDLFVGQCTFKFSFEISKSFVEYSERVNNIKDKKRKDRKRITSKNVKLQYGYLSYGKLT